MRRKFPLITAHAGCLGTVPNSVEAVLAALSSDADIVEVDIRATRDGVVVLTHDDSFELEDGKRARVEDLDWDSIRRFPARSETDEVIRIEALFELVGHSDKVLNLDSKEPRAMLLSTRAIAAAGKERDVVFSGLYEKDIAIAANELRRFRYLFNADAVVRSKGGGVEGMVEACEAAAEFRCSGINLQWKIATEERLEYARRRCVPVMLWTVDREADMKAVLDLDPYSVTSNRPDILRSLIDERNLSPSV